MSETNESDSLYAFVASEAGLHELALNVGFDSNGYVVILCGMAGEPTVSVTMAPGAAVRLSRALMTCVAHAGAEIVGQLEGGELGDEGAVERAH